MMLMLSCYQLGLKRREASSETFIGPYTSFERRTERPEREIKIGHTGRAVGEYGAEAANTAAVSFVPL